MNIHQVMDALDYGDAVSNHAVNLRELLLEMGYNSGIYSKYVHNNRKQLFNPVDKLKVNNEDIILFHFSGKSEIVQKIIDMKCKKLLVYHNVTPAHFFEKIGNFYKYCNEGLKQLKNITHSFDGFIADSEFNKNDLNKMGVNNVQVLPIVIDFEAMSSHIINESLLSQYKSRSQTNFLFVGRVAPNKKHEDIIDIFEYYYTNINRNSNLIFVGNYEHYMEYYTTLIKKIQSLHCKSNITFTGKVSSEDLHTYYKLADIFLCMSEHEGFCVPLLESMHYSIPTLAFDAGAIKYTMGDAGILIYEKDHKRIAELCNVIISDESLKEKIINKQKKWLIQYERQKIKDDLERIIRNYV